jgi:hypothetical protein
MHEATARETPGRVLIVDDDQDLCEVLADAQNEAGFQSAACTTAIVLSGYSRPEGVDLTWFRKPVDTDALVTALRRAN